MADESVPSVTGRNQSSARRRDTCASMTQPMSLSPDLPADQAAPSADGQASDRPAPAGRPLARPFVGLVENECLKLLRRKRPQLVFIVLAIFLAISTWAQWRQQQMRERVSPDEDWRPRAERRLANAERRMQTRRIFVGRQPHPPFRGGAPALPPRARHQPRPADRAAFRAGLRRGGQRPAAAAAGHPAGRRSGLLRAQRRHHQDAAHPAGGAGAGAGLQARRHGGVHQHPGGGLGSAVLVDRRASPSAGRASTPPPSPASASASTVPT